MNYKRQLKDEKYDGKNVLYSQKIKGGKQLSKYDLEELYKQRPNRKLLWAFQPYVRAYFLGTKKYNPTKIKSKYEKKISKIERKISRPKNDSSKVVRYNRKKARLQLKQKTAIEEGNWLMRTVGEPPSLFDSLSANETQKQLELYLQSKGYFHGTVTKKINQRALKRRKVKIEYQITTEKPHLLRNVQYISEDPIIQRIINNKKGRVLKPGQPYEVTKISTERERLFVLMKNSGYFDFQRQFIRFKIDTLHYPFTADIKIIIEQPDEGKHQQYKINEVIFFIDANAPGIKDTIEYNNIRYVHSPEKFSKKILNGDIKIRPGDSYSISNTQTTQQKLGNIDIFKFVNITYQKTDSNQLIAYIHTSSFEKYQFTQEFGVNINVNQGHGLPGPFIKASLKDRKVFNAFEILDINGRYSLESQLNLTNQDQVFRSTEWGINTSLTFPKLLFPGKFKYNLNNLYPKTRLQIGFTDVGRVEYERTSIKFAGGYELQNRKNQRITITPMDLNVINTRNKSEAFQTYLDDLRSNGNNLFQSFSPSIVSSFIITYIFNNNDLTKNKKAHYFKVLGESGGQTLRLIQSAFGNSADGIILTLPYYQFFKLNSEYRFYLPTTKASTLAFRINSGISKPYGVSSALPYEKFFFIGGLNSNRAWSPRRLGPGTYLPRDENGDIDYRFEQQGEIIIESNLEYRGKIGGFVHGAAFIDVGNVWTINQDDARPGSRFDATQIWKQLAVGMGVGLRFDFSFLIFRFDVGEKIWDPGRQELVPFKDKFARVYNIGIGYPF